MSDNNPYAELFTDEPFDLTGREADMPNKARGDDCGLPERVRAFVDEVADRAGRAPADYEVWHNDTQVLAFIPGEMVDVVGPAVNIDLGTWGTGPYDAGRNADAAAAAARAAGGWCAPTEAERWQWMSDAERAAEVAEARAAADAAGRDYIVVGGMTLPHPPTPIGFVDPGRSDDGLWDLPTVSINVNTEAFQARMAEARERIGDLAAGLAAAFEAINNGLSPAFARLGRALSRVTYWTPDGPPPPPIVDARTALIALNWAEWTEVVNHPDKPTRRHAKARYLEVRRHLPREYHRRLKSVPVNQFGSLT